MKARIVQSGLVACGALLLFAAQPGLAGTIVGSKHDFSTTGWAGGQICVACHAPHNALNPALGPLWNHAQTAATHTPYSSPSGTLNATVGQPGAVSKLCLSCHDGTVAVDSFGGNTGSTTIPAGANLGTNLSNDHPVGFTYNSALATADGALADPTVKTVTIGSGASTKTGTIAAVMLYTNQVECASCHDVHNTFTATTDKLVKITKAGSAICLACHIK